ncbi:hypothetical protein M5362_20875 [Streptomyces sp. Je 1-79]|uniref:hypothetical protein n=1 Tax=Streptomyces sp. Je 1-79 TaxID=2943847 RepID=UPI0021A3DC30|nr:hypothetical protein [Streptomyces sp. Je 1-79]MCT4355594.1 hypothetical protein [Streptomyces sp. Je 1-79]
MKPTKVAAIVAGSVMALGAAAPAMAAEPMAVPTSLNGGLGTLASEGLKTDALSSTTDGSVVKTVGDTANQLNETTQNAPLIGGLPLGG